MTQLLLNRIIQTATDNTPTSLKRQTLLEKTLNDQETLNQDLYEKIYKSGFITLNLTTPTSITRTISINSPILTQLDDMDYLARSDLISSLLPFNDMIKGKNVFRLFWVKG
jgi:hypothetical protein